MKYIILSNDKGDKAVITFSEDLVHSDVASGVLRGRSMGRCPFPNIHSAGFYYIDNGQVKTTKGSESLKLNPKEGDETILADHLRNITISNLDTENLRIFNEIQEFKNKKLEMHYANPKEFAELTRRSNN